MVGAARRCTRALLLAADDDLAGGPLHRPGRAVPRHRADHRLHRRGHDAVPVRAHAGRRRRLRLAGRDDARASGSPAIVLGLGLRRAAGRSASARRSLGDRSPASTQANAEAATSQGIAAADLHPLRLRLRGHLRAADHRRGRARWCWPTASGSSRRPSQRELSRARGSAPAHVPRPAARPRASTPGTTRSTPRRCCPTARRRGVGAAGAARCAATRGTRHRRPRRAVAGELDRRGEDEHEPRRTTSYLVRDAVHHRRRRRADPAQRDRRVHVRRADAQRRATSRSSRSPGCTATSTGRSSRSSSWSSPPPRSSSAWRSS